MTSFTVHETAYRAAIALNNMAVSLQERRCDRQALDTFQDALDMCRMASSSLPIDSHSQAAAETLDIRTRLRKATERLSSPMPMKRRHSRMSFSVLSDDADCVTALESISSHGEVGHAILIRIEEYGSESASLRDIDLDSSAILQNFGVSYHCLTLAVAEDDDDDNVDASLCPHRLRKNATNVLELAQSLISKKFSDLGWGSCACGCDCSDKTADSDENMDGDDIFMAEKVLFLASVTTKSMVTVLSSAENCEFKVMRCYERMTTLEGAMLQLGLLACPESSVSRSKLAPAA